MRLRWRIPACLALGAVVSYGVAWSVELLGPDRPPPASPQVRVDLAPRGRYLWLASHHAGFGHDLYIFRLGRSKTPDERKRNEARALVHHVDLPSWVERPTFGMYQETHAFGWPLRCVRRRKVGAPQRDFLIIDRSTLTQVRVTPIPVRPIATGLIGDTVVYGAAIFLVVTGPGAVRRRARRRRGRCPACGYDLRGRADAACPECGSE